MLPVLLGRESGANAGPIISGPWNGDVKKTFQDADDTAQVVARRAVAAWSQIRGDTVMPQEFEKDNEISVGDLCQSMSSTLLAAPENTPETRDLLRRLPEALRAVQKYITVARDEEEKRQGASCQDAIVIYDTIGVSSSGIGGDTEGACDSDEEKRLWASCKDIITCDSLGTRTNRIGSDTEDLSDSERTSCIDDVFCDSTGASSSGIGSDAEDACGSDASSETPTATTEFGADAVYCVLPIVEEPQSSPNELGAPRSDQSAGQVTQYFSMATPRTSGYTHEGQAKLGVSVERGRLAAQQSVSTSMVRKYPQMLNPVLKSRVNTRLHGSIITDTRGRR